MRLSILDHGHRPLQKIQLALVKMLTGSVPGPLAFLSYRPEFAAKSVAACSAESMRGAKSWRVWEVEAIAAFVSHRNRCRF